MKKLLLIASLVFFISCKTEKKESPPTQANVKPYELKYAKGFTLEKSKSGITIIKITSPWPGAKTTFTYALVPKDKMGVTTLKKDEYDAIIAVPVERLVVTSTTHIPSLESLGVGDRLVGFPNTDMISAKATRKRIDDGSIKELGNNESINTEIVIGLHPEVVVGFGMNNQNKAYETIERSHIPVVYNGDWTEESPLGKAEWIKFFAPFFQREAKADSIFKTIESAYDEAKSIAEKAKEKPTVLTGGLYKDVWHVAGGKSWMAQFLRDAQTEYLWADTNETGGIGLSVESVLETGVTAAYWLNPSMLTSYNEMEKANRHYKQFEAFKHKKVFSNTIAKGATGGLVYYELAPNRPDLVLRDLIHIFHPELLPDHQLIFFRPLK